MNGDSQHWFLEGAIDDGNPSWRTVINCFPFVVGRGGDCNLTLPSAGVSTRHAEFIDVGGGLVLRDRGSTNGTFVNMDPVEGETTLASGDVIHFADLEFRVMWGSRDSTPAGTMAVDMAEVRRSQEVLARRDDFLRMVQDEDVRCFFQPIVELSTRKVMGYEMLGRGRHPDFPRAPAELFATAEQFGYERSLSEAFRARGLQSARRLEPGLLFVNTHPVELLAPLELAETMIGLRDSVPEMELVIEVHEMAIADVESMLPFRERLRGTNVKLAFDDFGKGQSRLHELAELSPHFVKFDRCMIADLDRAPRRRQEMLRAIVEMVRDLGVKALAEGIEREPEAAVCEELGFQLGQGFHFRRPAPASELVEDSRLSLTKAGE